MTLTQPSCQNLPDAQLFHDGGPYHTSPLICSANYWTGFHMIRTSIMKELKSYLRNTVELQSKEEYFS